MIYSLRPARPEDAPVLRALLPQLAEFDVPKNRQTNDLWQGDVRLMEKLLAGEADNSHVIVAADASDTPIGMAMYTIKPELLSGERSGHLEALVVHENHLRAGLGKRLIESVESDAAQHGATGLSLHVFSNNTRARSLYEACGFDEEIVRCYKSLA